jgi:hypothetical protein
MTVPQVGAVLMTDGDALTSESFRSAVCVGQSLLAVRCAPAPRPPRDGSGGLGHQGAQADFTHQRRQAYALSAGFLLQRFKVLFREAHQDLARQLSLLAVAHVLLQAPRRRPPHLVVTPLVYDIYAVK